MSSIGSFIKNYDEDPAKPSLEEVKAVLSSAMKIGTQPQQVVQCLALYDIRNVLLQIRNSLWKMEMRAEGIVSFDIPGELAKENKSGKPSKPSRKQ